MANEQGKVQNRIVLGNRLRVVVYGQLQKHFNVVMSSVEYDISREGDRPIFMMLLCLRDDLRVELFEIAIQTCVVNSIQNSI